MAEWLLRRAANPLRVVRAVRRRLGGGLRERHAEFAPPVVGSGGDWTLDTERTVLRPFSPRDLDRLASQMSRPGVGPSPDRWRADYTLSKEIAETYLTWVVWGREDGDPLGIVGLSLLEIDGRPEHELGYRVFPRAEGRGLATEAARAVRTFAENELGVCQVISIVEPTNAASIRVITKIGLRHEKDAAYGGVPVRLYRSPSDAA